MTTAAERHGAAERSLRDDAKLAALEQRVYGLERGVHDLNQLFTGRIGEVSAQLAGLTSKLDERSRTPWATIVSAMGVVLAIVIAGGQLAKAPVDDALARLGRDHDRLQREAASAVSFAEFKAAYESDRALARQDAEARCARLDGAHAAIARRADETAVPRGELAERRRAEEAEAAALQRQIDELKAASGGLSGARDAILELRERLDRVERSGRGG